MQLAEVSAHVVHLAGAASGALLGLAAGKTADVLPRRRYGIAHVATGAKRTRRNALLVLGCSLVAYGVAHVLYAIPGITAESAAILFAANAITAAIVLTAAAIDFEHMILPLELTIGGTLVCLASAPARHVGLFGSAVGAAVCFALTFLPFLLYKRLRGASGMGMGDAHLAVLAGAWHGWLGGVLVIFAGALQSTLTAVAMRALGIRYATPESVKHELEELRKRAAEGDEEAKADLADDPMAAEERDGTLGMRLPLGPFLALGCIEVLFLRRYLVPLVERALSP